MRAHMNERPYLCYECEKVLSKIGNHTVHMRMHNGQKPYECNQCDKAFLHTDYLIIHLKTHIGENILMLEHFYKEIWYLSLHICTHTGKRPYICNQYDKAFS